MRASAVVAAAKAPAKATAANAIVILRIMMSPPSFAQHPTRHSTVPPSVETRARDHRRDATGRRECAARELHRCSCPQSKSCPPLLRASIAMMSDTDGTAINNRIEKSNY
jgi:hypothetical protein